MWIEQTRGAGVCVTRTFVVTLRHPLSSYDAAEIFVFNANECGTTQQGKTSSR